MHACQILLFLLICLGYLLILIGLFTPYWKVQAQEDTTIDTIVRHEGIWIQCTTYSTGNYDCDDFNRPILGLPIDLVIGRIVGIFAALLGLAGILVLLCACDCCKQIAPKRRKMLNLSGGCLTIASGIGLIAAMGFYANIVLQNYYLGSDPFGRRRSGYIREEFGWSLFVGWAGGAIQVISGFFLEIFVCCCLARNEEEQPGFTYNSNGARNYAYRPEQPAPLYGKEYV